GITFFSTKPTSEAPKGMIHWFRPQHPFPDLHSIVNFKLAPGVPNFLVLNADSILIRPAAATAGQPDTVVVFDHRPDTNLISDSARAPGSLRPCVPAATPEPCAHARDLLVGIGAAVARLKKGWTGSCPLTIATVPPVSATCDSSGKSVCNDAAS